VVCFKRWSVWWSVLKGGLLGGLFGGLVFAHDFWSGSFAKTGLVLMEALLFSVFDYFFYKIYKKYFDFQFEMKTGIGIYNIFRWEINWVRNNCKHIIKHSLR
jgi:hypothetical protein